MSELYHYGIKGMRWGVRRYQKENGALTSAGKKRYAPTRTDELMYGKKGAQRIADRRNKGDSRKTAVRKEFTRQVATGFAVTAIGTAAVYAYTSGEGAKVLSSGKKAVSDYLDSRKNVSILDRNGNVITSYHETLRVGESIVNAMLKKR